MFNIPSARIAQTAWYISTAALLPGFCRAAPSVEVAGAYFPAWLGCGLVGVAGAIVARVLMVVTGLAEVLPLQLLVCLSIGLLLAALAWIAWIGL